MCWLQLTPDIMGTKTKPSRCSPCTKGLGKDNLEEPRSCWAVQPMAVTAGHAPCSLLPDSGISSSVCVWAGSWDLCWFCQPPEPRLLFLVCFGLCLTAVATPVIPPHPRAEHLPTCGLFWMHLGKQPPTFSVSPFPFSSKPLEQSSLSLGSFSGALRAFFPLRR